MPDLRQFSKPITRSAAGSEEETNWIVLPGSAIAVESRLLSELLAGYDINLNASSDLYGLSFHNKSVIYRSLDVRVACSR